MRMRMTRREFDRRFAENVLAFAFIGMSGVGKTHQAKQFISLGFRYISCDDLIAPRISSMTKLRNVTDVGIWMGQPYSKGYRERERRFLELEEEVTREALGNIKENTVIDTTGSVIYLSEALHQRLKENSIIVYFKTAPEMYKHMLKIYLDNPKPVVWGDSFRLKKGEDERAALERSYPELLEFRAKKYQEFADVTIAHEVLQENWDDAELLLRAIQDSLT